ncbi:hypothetical protein [Acinetobacter soli]|uniref:hypothetical protein n=1 Tax=Acinetobacter soli TaxID=487316 RepID=UPI00370A3C05
MKKQVFGYLFTLSSCTAYAAPMDAFNTIPDFQPDRNLIVNTSFDYFKANSKAKNDNQRDYTGFTLGSRYILNPNWYTDLNYWNRTIQYGASDNDFQSWKLGLNYVSDFTPSTNDTLAFGVSFWGNYADQFDKSSKTKYKNYTLSEASIKKPQDLQLQLDAIYSKKFNQNNTFNLFANAAYSKVKTEAISGIFSNKNCNFDIHIDKNNQLTGQLKSPCTLNNTTVNNITLSADARQYGVDIQNQLNYDAVILGLGANWQWQYENFKSLIGYNFQYFMRDIPKESFIEQRERTSNHTIALELSYAITPEWNVYLQNQFFLHSFTGEIPSLYNPITAAAMDKSYNYVSIGIRFTPF